MSTPNTALKRTAQQSLAAQPAFNAWVSANAGTGKTRVLVDRIARLMLDGASPEKILCLTFTKTAAAEMAERINTQLGAWAVMDDRALVENLHALTGTPPDDETCTRARKLFARVLDVPGGLKIRTIHSFCEGLIGRFPIEAGVAPNFTVIDERSAAELLNDAKERILARIKAEPDGALAHAVEHLAELVDEETFAALMQTLTGRRNQVRAVLHAYGRDGELARAVTAEVGLGPEDSSREAIVADALSAQDEAALKEAAEILATGGKKDQNRSAGLKAWLALCGEDRLQRYADTFAPLFLTKEGAPTKDLTFKNTKAAEDVLRAEQDRVLDVMERLRARATADATLSLLSVGRAMLETYTRLKAVRAWLDYDDLIDKARGLLTTHDNGVSWVHYKLDGGIDHILVDESQDTSPAQWEVVQSLAEDFYAGLSRHEEVDEKPRTVFAVGDEKQSIYSFQGADPHEFGRLREHFQTRITQAGQRFEDVTLNVSFRSTRAVLSVVDKVFAQPGAADGLTFGSKRAAHESSRTGESGLVEVWPTITPMDKDEDLPWDVPLDYTGEASPDKRLAERIADTIRGWLDSGERLKSQDRPITEGDILILVRERKAFAEAMVRALKARSIRVAGADRMVLTDQMAVMDLLAAGRFAVLPEDDLSLAEVLKSPLVGFDDAALFALAYQRPASLWAALKQRAGERDDFARAHRILSTLLARADAMPPYEFYAALLRDGGRRAFLSRLGPDAEDPIDEFLSAAMDFERNHTPSLERFGHWITATNQTIKRDMEATGDEVRVMTVHGAKGLEAPVVFLTDTCTAPGAGKLARVQFSPDPARPGLLWSPSKDERCAAFNAWRDHQQVEQLQEYRRLLYVAMTRAADRLYVAGYEGKNGRQDGCWYDLIQPVIAQQGVEIDMGGEPGWRYETKQETEAKRSAKDDERQRPAPAPAWAFAPAPPEQSPTNPLIPSAPAVDEPPAFGPFEGPDLSRFKRGLLVHKLLETLPTLAPDQRRSAGARWLAQPAHDLDAETQAAILAETLQVLEDPELAALFAPDSLAEVAVSGVLGGHVVSARLDRLWVGETRVDVIDYKTNRPAPTDAENVPEAYLAQMAAYRALLANLYPAKAIRCVLLWTDGPHAMVLDDAILKAYEPPHEPAIGSA